MGCNHPKNDLLELAQVTLNKNTALWNDSGISSYRYEYRRSCFCLPQENVVEDGEISEAFYTPSETYLSTEEIERLFTVEGLFNVIQEAISSNVASLNVTYNTDYGYPERISIDVDKAITDEKILHIVTEFQ